MSKPRRRPELTYEEIEETGEFIVVDPADDRACVLSPTMGAIWILCTGSRDADAIAGEIADILGDAAPPRPRLLADVQRSLEELRVEGLIDAS